MRLLHWSKEPILSVHDTIQSVMNHKPNGLWVSDEDTEDSWSSWCESEMSHWINMPYVYEIILNPDANILFINTVEELNDFDKQYSRDDKLMVPYRTDNINWPSVALDYNGLIITPYQYSRRYALMWYASWDCASGCIWDSIAVNGLKTLRPFNAS